MAKGDASKVNSAMAEMAIATKRNMQELYSKCIELSYQSSGRLAPGFDAKDLIAWVRLNYPNMFDEKGKRIIRVE